MKTSAVLNPPQNPFIIIRQWQLSFCDGNACAAAILSFFEYCHNHKLAEQEETMEENKARKESGVAPKPVPDLFHYHTYEELEARLMIYSSKTIRKALELLCSKGAISVRNNPSPQFKFDHTLQYLLHPAVLNNYIFSIREISPIEGGKFPTSISLTIPSPVTTYELPLKEAREISLNNTIDIKSKDKAMPSPPKAPARTADAAALGREARAWLGGYCVAFSAATGGEVFCPSWARDMKIVKDLLKVFGVAVLTKRAELYLGDQDPFVRKNGYSIPIFRSRINAYSTGVAQTTEPVRPSHRKIVVPPGEAV